MQAWIKKGIIGLACVIVVVAPSGIAGAASSSSSGAGQGLEISPPVLEMSANPGQTVTATIRVRNVTQGILVANGQADDFGAGSDESGTPKLLLNETGATRYSLKYWVSPIPSITLAPEELKTTIVTISVPANAEPGGHYGVVRFTGVPPNLQGTGVALSASVGTLILMRVNGPITENLSVAQFSAGEQNVKTDTWLTKSFFESGPIDFLVRLHNGGSIHEQPLGTISIKSVFGGRPLLINVNPSGGNVLPDSYRRYVPTLDQKNLFGYYTATLAMTYIGKPLTGSVGFWVIPWKLVLLVFLGLIILFFLLRIGLKKYNEHIIATARRR
jgi:hypothetical protein